MQFAGNHACIAGLGACATIARRSQLAARSSNKFRSFCVLRLLVVDVVDGCPDNRPTAERQDGEQGGIMKVKLYSDKSGTKSKPISDFLLSHRVRFTQSIANEEFRRRVCCTEDVPALEIDGRIFINPNSSALEKILSLDE